MVSTLPMAPFISMWESLTFLSLEVVAEQMITEFYSIQKYSELKLEKSNHTQFKSSNK